MNSIKETSTTMFKIEENTDNKIYNKMTNEQILNKVLSLQKICLNLVQKKYGAYLHKDRLYYFDLLTDRTGVVNDIGNGRDKFNWIFIKDIEYYKLEQLDNGYISFTHKENPQLSNEKYHFYLHQDCIRNPYSNYLKELRQAIYDDKARIKRIHYTVFGEQEIKRLEHRLNLLKSTRNTK